MRQKLVNYYEPNLFYDNDDLENEFDSFFNEFYEEEEIEKETIKNKIYINPKDKIDLKDFNNEDLCVLYQNGNENALEALIIKNERLIYSRVEKYKNTYMQDLLEEDLFQDGAIGMITAAKRFDISLGYKFSTYATHWIDQSITRKIENEGFTIRVPVHVFENVNRLRREVNEVEFLNLNYSDKFKLLKKYTGFSEEEIYNLSMIYSNILNSSSLNILMKSELSTGASGRVELINLIKDETENRTIDTVFEKIFREDILAILKTLDDREEDIIKKRYGFINDRPRTLEEIGNEYGLTRERIRQIENNALDKLKNTGKASKIKEYLYEN